MLASLFAGTAITLLPLMSGSTAKQTSGDDDAVRILLYFVVLLLLAYIGFASSASTHGTTHQPESGESRSQHQRESHPPASVLCRLQCWQAKACFAVTNDATGAAASSFDVS